MNTDRSPTQPPAERSGPPAFRKPALWVRLLLLGLGWLLVLIGIAGLVLPGIQGILTILLGAAILSIASETVHRLLRRLLRERWPAMWQRLNGFRRRWRERLTRRR